MSDDFSTRLGARIVEIARERGLEGPAAIARASGLVRPVVHRILSGERRANVDHLLALASALDVAPGDLLPGRAMPAHAVSAHDAIDRYLAARADDLAPRQRRLLELLRVRLSDGAVLAETDVTRLLQSTAEVYVSG